MAQYRQNESAADVPTTPTLPSELNAQIDLLVSLHLWVWPALTLAVQNGWGGDRQISSDKRDWLAGAISQLLTANPPQISDVTDLEEVLMQVMLDEFEIVVDDGSAEETARKIWSGAEKLQKKEVTELQEMYTKWVEKQAKGEEKVTGIVRGEDKEADDTDWDDEDEDGEEWNGSADDGDVDMTEVFQTTNKQRKEKLPVEVDGDGFTKVVNKKKW